jgi:hypothetical protein
MTVTAAMTAISDGFDCRTLRRAMNGLAEVAIYT